MTAPVGKREGMRSVKIPKNKKCEFCRPGRRQSATSKLHGRFICDDCRKSHDKAISNFQGAFDKDPAQFLRSSREEDPS